MMILLSFLLILFAFAMACADTSVDFLRITCIPEVNYFEVEYKSVGGDWLSFVDKENRKRYSIWRKHGYYDPRNLRYECKLPESTYLITSAQPPPSARGMCGAAPSITLSLLCNDKIWLDNVIFGENCFHRPSVTKVEIQDQGNGYRNINLCISPANESPNIWEFINSRIPRVTQRDIEGYAEAKSTKENSKLDGQSGATTGRLDLEKFLSGPCAIPNLELPKNVVVYVAGDYGQKGKPLGYQLVQDNAVAKRIDVIVNERRRPVVLMLGAYEPMLWNIQWTPGTNILAAFASGQYRQAVAGLPRTTPVLLSYPTEERRAPCKSYFYDTQKNENRKHIDLLAKEVYGRTADRIFDIGNGSVVIGEPLVAGTKTLTSQDIPPESFFDPSAPLAGIAGLQDAMKKGILRQANDLDANAWKIEYAKTKHGSDISPNATDTATASTPKVLTDTYVVLKPFIFPPGLFGRDMATFYILKGVPYPKGDPGHSTVYDFNTMKCAGPLC